MIFSQVILDSDKKERLFLSFKLVSKLLVLVFTLILYTKIKFIQIFLLKLQVIQIL